MIWLLIAILVVLGCHIRREIEVDMGETDIGRRVDNVEVAVDSLESQVDSLDTRVDSLEVKGE